MSKHIHKLSEHSRSIPSKRPREVTLASKRDLQPLAPSAILQRAALAPESLRPAEVVRMQQTLGNRVVGGLLKRSSSQRPRIQAKLTVNAPGDEYEQEADRVAEQVMRMPAVQRAELKDEDEEPEVMTKREPAHAAGGVFEAGEAFEQQLLASRGQGQPLPAGLREEFETKFGADFSGVRVHADNQSVEMNRAIQARAFTHGQDIYLGAGQYEPGSDEGKRLMAHEAWHVVQQKQGRVPATRHAAGVALNDDPRLEREAEVMGARAARVSPLQSTAQSATAVSQCQVVQLANKPLPVPAVIKDAIHWAVKYTTWNLGGPWSDDEIVRLVAERVAEGTGTHPALAQTHVKTWMQNSQHCIDIDGIPCMAGRYNHELIVLRDKPFLELTIEWIADEAVRTELKTARNQRDRRTLTGFELWRLVQAARTEGRQGPDGLLVIGAFRHGDLYTPFKNDCHTYIDKVLERARLAPSRLKHNPRDSDVYIYAGKRPPWYTFQIWNK